MTHLAPAHEIAAQNSEKSQASIKYGCHTTQPTILVKSSRFLDDSSICLKRNNFWMYSGASLNKIDDHLKQHLNSPNDTKYKYSTFL